jgi:hypothetical protein
MRIDTTAQERVGKYNTSLFKRGDARKSRELDAADLVGDIFNNRTGDDEKEEVKLRLSRTSYVLTEDLHRSVREFLSENKEIAGHLEEVEVTGSMYTSRNKRGNFVLRKMNLYRQWLLINKEHSGGAVAEHEEVSNFEERFRAIHKVGKDEEIEAIYSRHSDKVNEVKELRKREVPNYYYIVYPEAYSFN